MNDKKTVGEKIRTIRKQKGWSQSQLAGKLKVSQQMIGQFENNKKPPKIETIEKIAHALGVHSSDLMGIEYFDQKIDIEKLKNDISDSNEFEKLFVSIYGQESYDSFQEYSTLTDEAAKKVREYIKDLCANPHNQTIF